MIIVAGRLFIAEGRREEFIHASLDAVRQARSAAGCIDFVVAADPLEPNRVNVFEAWVSEDDLTAFRGSGPDTGMVDLIEHAEVSEYGVN